MLLSAVSVLVVAQSSSEIPEGLMNNPVQYGVWALCAGYRLALEICNTYEYCFFAATMLRQMRLYITLYVMYVACPIELHIFPSFRASSCSSYTEHWRRIVTSPTLELQSFASFCILGIGVEGFVALEQIYLCALMNFSAVTANIRRTIPTQMPNFTLPVQAHCISSETPGNLHKTTRRYLLKDRIFIDSTAINSDVA